MKIKEGRFSIGTGNYLCENIRYAIYQCDECEGEGVLEMSLNEMIEYLYLNYLGKDKFKEFRKFIKDNIVKIDKNGKEWIYCVRCQNCGGAGEWEEWI